MFRLQDNLQWPVYTVSIYILTDQEWVDMNNNNNKRIFVIYFITLFDNSNK